jgi:cytochrome b pre-mRNA-processing protein 3
MGFWGILGRSRHERAGFALYVAAVRAAREPAWFTQLAVADTLDGRFDLVGLFVALMIHRLRALPPPHASLGTALAQAVFDAMFADMDFNLRELGVGDMSIGKRVRSMWEAFHGRALAYEAPLAEGDAAALSVALARNVWRGAAPEGAAPRMAEAALRQYAHVMGFAPDAWSRGEVTFLPAAAVLA